VYDRGEGGLLRDFLTAFVLAGGKSTRMGAEKAFVVFEGRTLLEWALESARAVTSDVRVVGDAVKFARFAPVVEDVFRECGPLGGIHAALLASRAELNFMLAVDVPFASPALFEFLIARAKNSGALVTVARVDGRFQPLCAVYRRGFADVAEIALRAGKYRIGGLFETGRTQVIEEAELADVGFSPTMFRNLNTPEELSAAHTEETIAGILRGEERRSG
jgi:molybdopterin-guanine dinucleotide biosynthesis protein A